MKKAEKAFKWIIVLLEEREVPYQVSGGLAAQAYGSKRPLFDIDLDIPNSAFEKLMPDIKTQILKGPERFRDEKWDLLLATLEYEGVRIDLTGGDDGKIFDSKNRAWKPYPVDFNKTKKKKIFELMVPVMPKQKLLYYKKILSRPEDLDDIKQLKEFYESRTARRKN